MSSTVTSSPVSFFSYRDSHGCAVKLSYQTLTPTEPIAAARTPLVLVQGWTGTKESWFGLSERLSKRRPVLVFDSRGQGQGTPIPQRLPMDSSAYPDVRPSKEASMAELVREGFELSPDLSTADLAEDAVSLARHVFPATEKLHWFGYSLGGAVVQWVAARWAAHALTVSMTSSFGPVAVTSLPEQMRRPLPVPPASHPPETEEEKSAVQVVGGMMAASTPECCSHLTP
jgi:pimeloyl-ACP methyl ester carboxylesterase